MPVITMTGSSTSFVNDAALAVVGRNVLTHRINNVVCAALGQALPDRASAAYYGNSNVYILSAAEGDGGQNVLFEIEVGGWGAQRHRDGHDCLSAGIHNLMNNPIEITEQEFPGRFVSYTLRIDSGGAGRYRGGMGVRRELELLSNSKFSAQFDRMKFPPPGFAGGAPGATARISVIGDDGVRDLPGKVLAHEIKRGERLIIESQGGGGYGPPSERDPAALSRDISEGRVSDVAAQRDYK